MSFNIGYVVNKCKEHPYISGGIALIGLAYVAPTTVGFSVGIAVGVLASHGIPNFSRKPDLEEVKHLEEVKLTEKGNLARYHFSELKRVKTELDDELEKFEGSLNNSEITDAQLKEIEEVYCKYCKNQPSQKPIPLDAFTRLLTAPTHRDDYKHTPSGPAYYINRERQQFIEELQTHITREMNENRKKWRPNDEKYGAYRDSFFDDIFKKIKSRYPKAKPTFRQAIYDQLDFGKYMNLYVWDGN